MAALLNWIKLVYAPFGRVTCTVHSISVQTSQKGIECTKAKEKLRSYCPNVYTVFAGRVRPSLKSLLLPPPHLMNDVTTLYSYHTARCCSLNSFLRVHLWSWENTFLKKCKTFILEVSYYTVLHSSILAVLKLWWQQQSSTPNLPYDFGLRVKTIK